ncbi:hypothetical protein SFB6_042G0, partial [Candidatus Arthromitus sp. SFB-co]
KIMSFNEKSLKYYVFLNTKNINLHTYKEYITTKY